MLKDIKGIVIFSFMTILVMNAEAAPRTGKEFLQCLQAVGEFLYRDQSPDAAEITHLPSLPNCYLDGAGKAIRGVVRQSVTNYREVMAKLTPHQRDRCAERWAESWAEAAKSVWTKKDWREVEHVNVAKPYEELDPLERELFVRAEIEREMVYRNQERGETRDGADCQFAWTNSLIAREDNLGFFKQKNLLEKFQNGALSPKVFPEFWLVIQHADMHVAFQAEALKVIERHGPDQAFPEVLIESLRKRVKTNRERQSVEE